MEATRKFVDHFALLRQQLGPNAQDEKLRSGNDDNHSNANLALTETVEFRLDGGRVRVDERFDRSDQVIHAGMRRGHSSAIVRSNAEFRSLIESNDNSLQGVIAPDSEDRVGPLFVASDWTPLFLAFRPTSASFGRQIKDGVRLITKEAQVDGVPCWLLEQAPTINAVTRTLFFVDPSREFSFIRTEVRNTDDSLRSRTDIRLIHHENVGWIPNGWRRSSFDSDGEIKHDTHFNVDEASTNVDFPEDTFELNFPPGTIVADLRAGIGQKSSEWIVNATGPPTLIHGRPSDITNRQPRRSSTALVVTANVTVVILAVIAFHTIRKVRRQE